MISINNIVRSVDRASNDSDIKQLNILTLCKGNEKYITLLSQLLHNFYLLPNQPWNMIVEKRPPNLQTLSLCVGPLDYIICFDRAEQYEEAQKIAKTWHVPIILVDMCTHHFIRPQNIIEGVSVKDQSQLYKKPALQVACTQNIQTSWNHGEPSITIPIGIDTDKFKNTTTDNDYFIAIDNHVPTEIGSLIGSKLLTSYTMIPTDHNDLTDIAVNKARYFINTYKTVTVKMLEAMSAGAVVITVKNPDTENFIKHLSTGILIDSLDDLPIVINTVENKDKDFKLQICKAARDKIIAEHSVKNFLDKWTQALTMLKSAFYTPPI